MIFCSFFEAWRIIRVSQQQIPRECHVHQRARRENLQIGERAVAKRRRLPTKIVRPGPQRSLAFDPAQLCAQYAQKNPLEASQVRYDLY